MSCGRNKVKAALNLSPKTPMEYKEHDASLRDKSSFGNADVFR